MRERNLIRLLTCFLVAGIFFMYLPGTLVGVWNMLEIGGRQNPNAATLLWTQAHGHAQLFGWIGSFILGIGYYSIPNLRKVQNSHFVQGWECLVLWCLGVGLRWTAGITAFAWQFLLPISAVLEAAAVALFVWKTIQGTKLSKGEKGIEPWAVLVISGTIVWLLLMLANLQMTIQLSIAGTGPAVPLPAGRRFLFAAVWGWVVPIVWGLSAKWLPVFLGLSKSNPSLLKISAAANVLAALLYCCRVPYAAELIVCASSFMFVTGLKIFQHCQTGAKVQGVHPTFPVFVRIAYLWLLVSAALFAFSAFFPDAAGTAGSARHAITVGYFSTMVFSMAPRILPAFLGRKNVFSVKLMFASLALLFSGCFLRVSSEILAYDFSVSSCWCILPASALIELSAMTLFAINMSATFLQKPILDEMTAAQNEST